MPVLNVTAAFRVLVLVLVLPPLVGVIAYRVLGLATSGASGALHLPARALLRPDEHTDPTTASSTKETR